MVEKLFLLPFFVTLLLSYALTPLVIKIAWKYGLVDDPKIKHAKKLHKKIIPRAGGLGIAAAIIMSSLIFLPLDKHLIGIILGVIFLTFVGILDDKYEIHPIYRLILQFIGASFPIAAGIGIAFVTNPINSGVIDLSQPQIVFELLGEQRSIWILSDIFALFWIVGLMNILNMGAKGVEGQLPGVAFIASITMAALSLKFSADIAEWPIIVLASITAGSFLGFLPFNFNPQQIMPAFSGSMIAGYMLAVLSILTTAKLGTLTIVLAVPIIDVCYSIVRRISQGKAPFWGDRGHLHHKLIDNGFSTVQVSILYWLITAILGFSALTLNSTDKIYTIIGLYLIIGILLIWLTYRKTK